MRLHVAVDDVVFMTITQGLQDLAHVVAAREDKITFSVIYIPYFFPSVCFNWFYFRFRDLTLELYF